jgi:nucleotide-binding universal stress UspA family protein
MDLRARRAGFERRNGLKSRQITDAAPRLYAGRGTPAQAVCPGVWGHSRRKLYKRILVANSGSLEDEAFGPALVLASRFCAELHMLLVKEVPRFPMAIGEVTSSLEEAEGRFAYIVAWAERRAKEANIELRAHVMVGQLLDRVVGFVEQNRIDLLVVCVARHRQLRDFIVGNPTERLIRAMPCAVHIVR